MSIQVKMRIDKEELQDVWISDFGGEIIIKVDGRVLFQSGVDVTHFWIIFIDMIKTFMEKEKKTTKGYYNIDFCIEKAKKKDEIIFSIECDEGRFRLSPVRLNKKEFFEKSLDCAISNYRELAKLDKDNEWGCNEEIQRILELKKLL